MDFWSTQTSVQKTGAFLAYACLLVVIVNFYFCYRAWYIFYCLLYSMIKVIHNIHFISIHKYLLISIGFSRPEGFCINEYNVLYIRSSINLYPGWLSIYSACVGQGAYSTTFSLLRWLLFVISFLPATAPNAWKAVKKLNCD